jgi:hypothetical protein
MPKFFSSSPHTETAAALERKGCQNLQFETAIGGCKNPCLYIKGSGCKIEIPHTESTRTAYGSAHAVARPRA